MVLNVTNEFRYYDAQYKNVNIKNNHSEIMLKIIFNRIIKRLTFTLNNIRNQIYVQQNR